MSKTHEHKETWLAALRVNATAMRTAFKEAAATETGLATKVPPCPEWSVLDLLHHVGGVYRFVRTHVSRGVTSRPTGAPHEQQADLPAAPEAIEWWAEQYTELANLLDTLDPEMPAWNWAPAAKRAGFWHRRMAHETAIHRWDAQMAVGQVEPIAVKLATDGVTEVLDTWLPAGLRRGPSDRSGVVHLIATDADHQWYIRLRGEGVALLDTDTWLDHDDHHTRATARGTASDLALALYGRVPFDLLEINGDATLLESLRTG